MIIKSLSRKGKAGSLQRGSFYQLYHYINCKAVSEAIHHNVLAMSSDEQTIGAFLRNASHIRHGKKNNILYHEIIALERSGNLEAQCVVLRDLAQKYLSVRAPNALAYGAIHNDAQNSVHLHLMISANDENQSSRMRLNKFEFTQLQKDMELYLQREYPQLGERTVYNKPWERTRTDKEYQVENRTQKASKKSVIKQRVQEALSIAATREELSQLLQPEGIEIIVRGSSVTAKHGKTKSRLKALGLLEDYNILLQNEHDPKAHAIRQLKAQRNQQRESREQNQDREL